MDIIKLTKKEHGKLIDVMKKQFPDYSGRKYRVVYRNEIDPNYNANWSGGSKTEYKFLARKNGQISAFSQPDLAPWNRNYTDRVKLSDELICITHSYFCGHDTGLTMYVPECMRQLQIENK